MMSLEFFLKINSTSGVLQFYYNLFIFVSGGSFGQLPPNLPNLKKNMYKLITSNIIEAEKYLRDNSQKKEPLEYGRYLARKQAYKQWLKTLFDK